MAEDERCTEPVKRVRWAPLISGMVGLAGAIGFYLTVAYPNASARREERTPTNVAEVKLAPHVFTPAYVKSQTNRYITCHLEYDWIESDEPAKSGFDKNTFSLNCRYDRGITGEMTCGFPNAGCGLEYKGSQALARAKQDFDASGIEGLILDGGFWEVIGCCSGNYLITDAVSPFTLKRLTERELGDIAHLFENQVVGARREFETCREDHRPDSYFQR